MSQDRRVYSVAEVARLVQCDPRIIRREITEGRLKTLPIKRPLRITSDALDEWMRGGK